MLTLIRLRPIPSERVAHKRGIIDGPKISLDKAIPLALCLAKVIAN